jgi:hypothetical protein
MMTGRNTYVDDFVCVPQLRVVLDDAPFGQEGNFDRVYPRLRPEHALNGLNELMYEEAAYTIDGRCRKDSHLDAGTTGHALYPYLALFRLSKGAGQRLILD